ncbi:MAG: hypothetical protein LBU42_03830 [Prevotellaceae bacterium]|nr:hypothetical protein [Prevotellaceae bacterium]
MQVERSGGSMGQDGTPCFSRGAQVFRYARTVRRAKGRAGFSAGCAALACGYEYSAPSGLY